MLLWYRTMSLVVRFDRKKEKFREGFFLLYELVRCSINTYGKDTRNFIMSTEEKNKDERKHIDIQIARKANQHEIYLRAAAMFSRYRTMSLVVRFGRKTKELFRERFFSLCELVWCCINQYGTNTKIHRSIKEKTKNQGRTQKHSHPDCTQGIAIPINMKFVCVPQPCFSVPHHFSRCTIW
jgi:hypothetical protein